MENESKQNTLKQTTASSPVPEAAGGKAVHYGKLIQTFQICFQANEGRGLKPCGCDNSCPSRGCPGTSFLILWQNDP